MVAVAPQENDNAGPSTSGKIDNGGKSQVSDSSKSRPVSKVDTLGVSTAGNSPSMSRTVSPYMGGPAIAGGRGMGSSKRLGADSAARTPGNQKHKKFICTLVVGPRSSGKTTLIKQARVCCGYRFSQEELISARTLMRHSVFESVKTLWREIHRSNVRIQNTEMMETLQRALTSCSTLNGAILPNDELIGAIGNFIYDYEVQNFIELNNLQRKVYSSTFD